MHNSNYEVQVLVHGKPVQLITHQGNTYVEGRVDTEYTLKVKNNNWSRVMAVISVDGINVISGKPATSKKSDPGYIIDGYSCVDIKGFRKDLNTVGAFKFCTKQESYCNTAGAPGNNGVIGVRIYSEKIRTPIYIQNEPWIQPKPTKWFKPWPTYTTNTSDNTYDDGHSNINYCSSQSLGSNIKSRGICKGASNSSGEIKSSSEFGIGTTWGEAVCDRVVTTEFEADGLMATFEIFYSTAKGLSRMGVPIKKEKNVCFPKAFDGFATPPKGWRG